MSFGAFGKISLDMYIIMWEDVIGYAQISVDTSTTPNTGKEVKKKLNTEKEVRINNIRTIDLELK